MLRPIDLIQAITLLYRSSTTTWLNRVSPLSVLFKEVLWMLSVLLNQIDSQSEFAMMMVSSCLCYINVTITYYKIQCENIVNCIYCFLLYLALIVRWAHNLYEFTESSQVTTVELVTDSAFEVAQFSIQGFPTQIPDNNPNRIPSLVVPGPAFVGKRGCIK